MQTKHLCVLIHIIRSKGELVLGNLFMPPPPPVLFLLTVPRWCFFKGSFFKFVFAFAILSCLFLSALWSPVRKGLTSWLSCMWCFLVFLSLPHMVSWVRCGPWLYRFLIFAYWWSTVAKLAILSTLTVSHESCTLFQYSMLIQIKCFLWWYSA